MVAGHLETWSPESHGNYLVFPKNSSLILSFYTITRSQGRNPEETK